ncbi:Osteoclast-stimulating factor 1 [Chamberlinius hualienensis]
MSRLALSPPKPAPKPGHVKVVKAMYKYTAQYPDELSFEEGETLYILDMSSDPNWWKAKCGERSGLIPSNYVEENTESIDNPLHEAAKRGNISFLLECLSNKVSVNGLDKAGSTALHWAARGGHLDCIEKLLEVPNIQINVQNKLGDTPLHSAAWKGHSEIVKLLLEKGARTDMLNKDDKTPYDLAKETETAALLKSHSLTKVGDAEDYGESDDSD